MISSYRVIPREDDEAEVVLLGSDEDLPGLGQRPPRAPHRPHQRVGVDLLGRGHRRAPGSMTGRMRQVPQRGIKMP